LIKKEAEVQELTFFAWADTHFGYEPRFGDKDIRCRAVKQMSGLPGYPYPPEVGGRVGEPAFVLHCGDFVDGGVDPETELSLYLHCMRGSDLPFYEVLGNHEEHPAVMEYFKAKHGGEYYSFEKNGVVFMALRQTFDQNENSMELDAAQLEWVAETVAGAGPGKPIAIFSHDRPDKLPNADELDRALAGARVILMLSGHGHLQRHGAGNCHYRWNDRLGVELGHCRDHPIDPIYGRTFAAVRIGGGQIAVVPWRWDLEEWAACQGYGAARGEHYFAPHP